MTNEFGIPKLTRLSVDTKGRWAGRHAWRWLFASIEWEMVEDWQFVLRGNAKIVIPAGYIYKIPRFLLNWLSPAALLLVPGLIHNYGYRNGYLLGEDDKGRFYRLFNSDRRVIWDDLFKEVSIQVNGMIINSNIGWLFLRWFGWISWDENKQQDILKAYMSTLFETQATIRRD